MKLNRRDFLSRASAAGLLGTGGLTGGLMSMPALAADTTGYKALVCVFMFGGMDHYDTVLPYDKTSYDSFATTRESLFAQYVSANSPRGRADLLALNPSNAGTLAGGSSPYPRNWRHCTPCSKPVTRLFLPMSARCWSQPTGRWS